MTSNKIMIPLLSKKNLLTKIREVIDNPISLAILGNRILKREEAC